MLFNMLRHFKIPFIMFDPAKTESIKQIDNWNKGRYKVFMSHINTVARGLNLQKGGNRILQFSPNYSNELQIQLIGRLLRQGSPYKDIFVDTIVVKGSIEIEITKKIRSKRLQFREFTEDMA